MTSIYDLLAARNTYQNPYQSPLVRNLGFNTALGGGLGLSGLGQSATTQFGIPATSQFANQQQIGSITSLMPGFNNMPVTPGVAQPPSSPLPAFDYGGLNQINNPMPFSNMPYVTQVPLQGFYTLGNGQTVSNTQYTAYIPSVVPGSITNLQQLSSLPAASPGSLAAILQLAGISPSVIGSSSLNNSGSLIPPVYGLKA
ncbi:MAG: hypothetical protein ACK551_02280 [Vampirovibrionales bacterium]